VEPYVKELAVYPNYYSDLRVWTFAPNHYYPSRIGGHPYSYQILLSKKDEDLSDYFLSYFFPMWNALKKEGLIGNFDLIAPLPSSVKGVYSKTLVPLGKKFGEKTGIPFDIVLDRTRELPTSRLLRLSERYERIKDSLRLTRNLKNTEKKVLILDDTRSSGVSCLEAAKILKDGGAEEVVLFCLGITENLRL